MFKNILLPIDLNEESSWRKPLAVAIDMCRKNDATLRVMTVIPSLGMSIVAQYFPKDYEKQAAQKALEHLKALVHENVPEDISVQHVVGEGSVYETILQIARETGADLIIMQSLRPELKDYLLGPNASRVVRHAECSVLVVRE